MGIPLDTILIFIPVALALNLTPGADMLFCLGQGSVGGPKAGFAAALGIATGSFLHSVLAGLGLAVLLARHPPLFDLLRWIGVAYLLYLAISSFKRSRASATQITSTRKGLVRVWMEGTLVCLLNPKVALFTLALVPQFVELNHGSVLSQFLIFGLIMNIGGTLINGAVGMYAGNLGRRLAKNRKLEKWLPMITASLFIGMAARLAIQSS